MRKKSETFFILVSILFSIWYCVSAVLLYLTAFEADLTGLAYKLFAFCTHFMLDLERFSGLQNFILPIFVAVFAAVTGRHMHELNTVQKKQFFVPPLLAGAISAVSCLFMLLFRFVLLPPIVLIVPCYLAWIICGALLLTAD